MPHHNVFSQSKSDTDLVNRFILVQLTKLTNNTYFRLAISFSLAIVAQGIGLNRSTVALDSHSSSRQQPIDRQHNYGLDRKSNLYLADNEVIARPTQIIHRVQQGDTVTKIASDYQVSREELVEVNQIQNSNVIFVNQRLQIPAIVAQDRASAKSEAAEEDPYIANLRAEIDRLRAQNRMEREAKNLESASADNTSTSTVLANSQAEVNLVAEEDLDIANLRTELDSLQERQRQEQVEDNLKPDSQASMSDSTSEVTEAPIQRRSLVATSQETGIAASSVGTDLVESETIALTLPPLIDEEYLPNAFEGYSWPAQGVLTSNYGWRWGRLHRGIDIAAPIGTPIVAAASGKVVGAGWHGGYGNLVKLEHADGSVTYYAHVNRILVTHGQKIKQGEIIAEMGSTGNSTGSHLHFEIHLQDRTIVNPLALLGSR